MAIISIELSAAASCVGPTVQSNKSAEGGLCNSSSIF